MRGAEGTKNLTADHLSAECGVRSAEFFTADDADSTDKHGFFTVAIENFEQEGTERTEKTSRDLTADEPPFAKPSEGRGGFF